MSLQDLFSLQGKTAIVTGGGRGLGQQIATVYAEAGANVVVCSRDVEACQQLSDALKEKGVRSLAFKCDVSNPEDIQHVVDETLKEFGSIDILVNNSGTSWGAPALEMPADKWDKVMDINLKAVFLFSQAVGKIMVEQRSGKIINIASIAGMGGQKPEVMDAIGYSVSKGAVITLTKDLAVKLAPHNVHVNAIAPGFFPTKMTKAILGYSGESILDRTPAGRFGSDEDMKGPALFLASSASDYVFGHVLVVDGGTTASVE
ncbi:MULTISPECIES: SDR family oxidoreductase [Neobacillus]|uniref:SDR family oxidoreductase n=1 Tax=Neobacillus rhizophilus TaxID=2833579 RepID=A0A942YTP6_9BACI|nr:MULTISPECIES: SDR family oxidoreductase [Neobacillus]MBS4212097.1 SDR family oxidoreductase [Neobacillus rhizophilus]MBU8915528.1 SDR family oxidoreductase [Bacillus sp. FJAT-29953]